MMEYRLFVVEDVEPVSTCTTATGVKNLRKLTLSSGDGQCVATTWAENATLRMEKGDLITGRLRMKVRETDKGKFNEVALTDVKVLSQK